MSQHFPKEHLEEISKLIRFVELCTKTDFKNAIGVDTSKLIAKYDLACLKAEIGKIDVDKLKTADLNKLSHVVKNDVVKKTVFDKLVAKVNNVNTSGFVLKTKYNTDKSNLEKKYW